MSMGADNGTDTTIKKMTERLFLARGLGMKINKDGVGIAALIGRW